MRSNAAKSGLTSRKAILSDRVKISSRPSVGPGIPPPGTGQFPSGRAMRTSSPAGAEDYFDDAGADHHLFALVLDADGKPVKTEKVVRYWSDGLAKLGDPAYTAYVEQTPKQGSGWANIVVFNNYSPEAGRPGRLVLVSSGRSRCRRGRWDAQQPSCLHLRRLAGRAPRGRAAATDTYSNANAKSRRGGAGLPSRSLPSTSSPGKRLR